MKVLSLCKTSETGFGVERLRCVLSPFGSLNELHESDFEFMQARLG